MDDTKRGKEAEIGQSLVLQREGICANIPAICLHENRTVVAPKHPTDKHRTLSSFLPASVRNEYHLLPFALNTGYSFWTETRKVLNWWLGSSHGFVHPLDGMHFYFVPVWHVQAAIDKSTQASHSPFRMASSRLNGITCPVPSAPRDPRSPRLSCFWNVKMKGAGNPCFPMSTSKCVWFWTKHADTSISLRAACPLYLSSDFKLQEK